MKKDGYEAAKQSPEGQTEKTGQELNRKIDELAGQFERCLGIMTGAVGLINTNTQTVSNSLGELEEQIKDQSLKLEELDQGRRRDLEGVEEGVDDLAAHVKETEVKLAQREEAKFKVLQDLHASLDEIREEDTKFYTEMKAHSEQQSALLVTQGNEMGKVGDQLTRIENQLQARAEKPGSQEQLEAYRARREEALKNLMDVYSTVHSDREVQRAADKTHREEMSRVEQTLQEKLESFQGLEASINQKLLNVQEVMRKEMEGYVIPTGRACPCQTEVRRDLADLETRLTNHITEAMRNLVDFDGRRWQEIKSNVFKKEYDVKEALQGEVKEKQEPVLEYPPQLEETQFLVKPQEPQDEIKAEETGAGKEEGLDGAQTRQQSTRLAKNPAKEEVLVTNQHEELMNRYMEPATPPGEMTKTVETTQPAWAGNVNRQLEALQNAFIEGQKSKTSKKRKGRK
jgi:hypothetical protein